MRLPECFAEEPFRRRGVPLGREQKVDGLAPAVHGAIEVSPASLPFDVCLITPPRAIARAQMWPDPLLQLWRIGLDPAKQGRVVDRDATVLQHQFEIAVADREHQVPAHGPQDHLGRELPALERLALRHDTRAAIRLVETARLSNPDPPHKLAISRAGADGRRSQTAYRRVPHADHWRVLSRPRRELPRPGRA